MRLDVGQARSLFAGARVARLATVDSSGGPSAGPSGGSSAGSARQPHVVPVTFALEAGASGDVVYIAVDHKPKTTTNLKRLRNIAANPLVSAIADHYCEDWDALWWARADGQARIISDEAARRHPVDLLVAKYPQYAGRRPEGPVISIAVTRWSGWAASPGAVRDTG